MIRPFDAIPGYSDALKAPTLDMLNKNGVFTIHMSPRKGRVSIETYPDGTLDGFLTRPQLLALADELRAIAETMEG